MQPVRVCPWTQMRGTGQAVMADSDRSQERSAAGSRDGVATLATPRSHHVLTVLALISPSSLSISLHYPISLDLSSRAGLLLASPTLLSLSPGCADMCWSGMVMVALVGCV
jgi:hypothetical protein